MACFGNKGPMSPLTFRPFSEAHDVRSRNVYVTPTYVSPDASADPTCSSTLQLGSGHLDLHPQPAEVFQVSARVLLGAPECEPAAEAGARNLPAPPALWRAP
jgi:hypothetical protein